MSGSGVAVRSRYLIALLVLALVGVLQLVVLTRLIGDQRATNRVVNLAGRQRMLSQRVALMAAEFVTTENRMIRRERRAELLVVASEMELRHAQLRSGDRSINPPGWPPSTARAIYFGLPVDLDVQLTDYVDRVRALSNQPGSRVTLDNADMNYILARRDAILNAEDAVVRAYVSDGEARSSRLVLIESGLSALELIVLGVVLFALFIPMEREIARQRLALVEENAGLAAVVAGSQKLAETLAIESLLARFVSGAERLLHVPVVVIGDPPSTPVRFDESLAAQSPERIALVHETLATHHIAQSEDRCTLALSINVFGPGGRLAIIAQRDRPFRATDLFALELFASNLLLAAHNATLFHDLELREAHVAELDKLKSDLIAMLAHDFKGPLTSIIGYAELMKEGFIDGAEVGEAAAFIANSAWRLSSLASDTLTMSLLERNEVQLERAPTDLVELVSEAIAGSNAASRVFLDAVPESIELDLDSRRLRQVFDNLIGNALKYAPDESAVTVSVRCDEMQATIEVSDRGIGIPTRELDRVFDRFSRASNARESGIAGTGFGLYLTKMLVELHGGTIAVRSTVGSGSTFTVTLPVRREVRRPALAPVESVEA